MRRLLLFALLTLPAAAAQGLSGADTALELTPPPRFSAAPTSETPKPFSVSAQPGTTLEYVQVHSTVLELTGLQVSGLGNAANAALEQRLRAALTGPGGLSTLGESGSRRLSLSVDKRAAAGTELLTRWQAKSGEPITLSQTLLGGAAPPLVQISSPSAAEAAEARAVLNANPRDLSLGLDAPYGLLLSEGESQQSGAQRDLQPLLSRVTALTGRALGPGLPLPQAAPPILIERSTLYQGRNSRGNLLFQAQGNMRSGGPWQMRWQGTPERPLGQGKVDDLLKSGAASTLLAEIPTASEFSQSVYRADGLPDSAFEFSTLTLRLFIESGGANLQIDVQLRRTLALRPTASLGGLKPSPGHWVARL